MDQNAFSQMVGLCLKVVVLDKKKSESLRYFYTFYGHFIAVEKTHFKSIFTQFFTL